jgi:hypothetical protein
MRWAGDWWADKEWQHEESRETRTHKAEQKINKNDHPVRGTSDPGAACGILTQYCGPVVLRLYSPQQ